MENLVIHIFEVGMLQELQYKLINGPRHTLFQAVHPIFIYLAITHYQLKNNIHFRSVFILPQCGILKRTFIVENLVIHIFEVGMLQGLQYKSINRPRHTLFRAVHPIFIYLAITHQFPLFDENLPRYLST